MTKNLEHNNLQNSRLGPRVSASIDVDVEVAGQKRRMHLTSTDIGSGGIFIRTDTPAPLWKKVKISLSSSKGEPFEVSGEVVRSIAPDLKKLSNQPCGMAIAFDENSRTKSKRLVELVLELCSQRKTEKKPGSPSIPISTPIKKMETDAVSTGVDSNANKALAKDSTDILLDQIDALLESVEKETPPLPQKMPAENPKSPPKQVVSPKQVRVQPPATPPPIPKKTISATPGGDSVNRLKAALLEYTRTRKGETYYDVLGVSLKATPEEIKQAYQKLLNKLKPETSPESIPKDVLQEMTDVLGKVRKAFAILSKPDRRRAYDFLIDNSREGDEL